MNNEGLKGFFRGFSVSRRFDSLLIASSLFLLHLAIVWVHSGTWVSGHYANVFVFPFRAMQEQALFTLYTQRSFYIGNQLYLLPLFKLAGTSPQVLKAVSVFFAALSSPTMFYVFRLRYSVSRSLLMVLPVFTMAGLMTFRYVEMPAVWFFTAILLYLFVRWYDRGEDGALYLLGFFGGLFFYFKAIHLYPFAALFLGALLVDRERLFSRLTRRKLAVFAGLLVLGALPFLLYTWNTGFHYADDIINYRAGGIGYEGLAPAEVTERRISQIAGLTAPVFTGADTRTGPLAGLHLYTLLLASGLAVAWRRRELLVPVAAVLTFVFLHYVPRAVSAPQVVVLFPFIPFVLGYNLDAVPEFPGRDRALVILMALLVTVSVAGLDVQNRYEDEMWSTETHEYREFQAMNVSGSVVTDSYHMFLLAAYDQSIDSVHILSSADILGPHFGYVKEVDSVADGRGNYTLILAAGEEVSCEPLGASRTHSFSGSAEIRGTNYCVFVPSG